MLAGAGTYLPGTRYTLLTATGGVTGQFTNLQTATNLAFLTPSLSYDANAVFLNLNGATIATIAPDGTVVTTPVTFPSVAFSHNQAGDRGRHSIARGPTTRSTAVLTHTALAARAAFDAPSGEVHASAVTAGSRTLRLERDAISAGCR